MNEVGDNILKFNTYVKGLVHSLYKCGEYSHDLLINAIKGYVSCKDKQYKYYILSLIKRDEDDPMLTLTIDYLIVKATNKYKLCIQNSTWKVPDEVNKELMALYTEVNCTKSSKPIYYKKEWKPKDSKPKGSKHDYFILYNM